MILAGALCALAALPALADATTAADGKVSVKFFGEGL
jgi:hypothetical protein